ncbi:hypothetical protein JG687_00012522 [Phytophthora cactorum]|uniref:Uncharacterized protein n=1 Tax=Phytophthora cactorum TaxID=29920 RepID=A0A8T1U472_9STRA|nr:hypothetical protein JG687_00012522 [Phytophthora cactorum]
MQCGYRSPMAKSKSGRARRNSMGRPDASGAHVNEVHQAASSHRKKRTHRPATRTQGLSAIVP